MRLNIPDDVKEIQEEESTQYEYSIYTIKTIYREDLEMYICTCWERTQLAYLNPKIHNSESLCRWCISHHIKYQILYPIFQSTIFKNPYKYFKYLQLKARLEKAL